MFWDLVCCIMKLLVISDTHLSLPFDIEKYHLLKRIISKSDQVIINGDFWEGFLLTFDEFFNSKWSKLFPLLKEKNTVYIFGNHDKKKYSDTEKIKEFSTIQTDRYVYKKDGKTYVFEHGDRFMPFEKKEINIKDPKVKKQLRRSNKIEKTVVKLFGSSYQRLFKIFNIILRKRARRELENNELFFCGHTHIHEINHKNKFYNTGMIKHGLAQYIYIENGEIISMNERY